MNQPALFTPADVPTGDRHAQMLETAIAQARRDGYLETLDEAAVSLARANARALDQAEADRKYYAIAQLSGPYMELLREMKLIPSARNTDADDAITQALAALSTPTIRHASADD
ncbi:hypothetical protein [Corynebacterium freiburgense]|uniref:hypothetical protein n=1 Tax=Corynebacterium freiburgense TaxID=556548 RepID=UPI0004198ECE|nr:hypothetical protein [Corynebacterium freiburgense]WJZ03465.1 hypothetical protein CFREI_10980 [Corynebacterium freiburgense]WJZ03583.1 hypothetical protein CFREI_11620 [Corynebacterium freiburgense]WJZ04000.1 hypothetical protein CFREI_13770 [Corynebacterium freiburgense]